MVSASARGDATAFRRLTERHAPGLHRLAFRMMGDASEAEDVVQDAFLRLWDHAVGWQSTGGGVPGWLRRVATNLCFDRLRRRSRLSDAEVPERADDRPRADATLAADRLGEIARRALASLAERQRAAIVLTYYEELSNAEAAATLEMNIKGFESLLFRARASLRAAVVAAGVGPADLESA